MKKNKKKIVFISKKTMHTKHKYRCIYTTNRRNSFSKNQP